MRKDENRTRQLQTVKVDPREVRRALQRKGVPLSKASREMGYADDYLSNRLKEDGCVPVIVGQLLRYKYGVGEEQTKEDKDEQIPVQLSIEDIERGKRIEEKAKKDRRQIEAGKGKASQEAHEQHVRDLYHLMTAKYKEINGDTAKSLLRAGGAETLAKILMEDLGLIPEEEA